MSSAVLFLPHYGLNCCYIILASVFWFSYAKSDDRLPSLILAKTSQILGTQTDAKARTGERKGYSVLTKCRSPYQFGVIGRGTRWGVSFEGIENPNNALVLAFTTFRDTKLLPALLALHSVHATGLGGGCTRMGAIVYIFDWREVDDAIEMIGNMLAHNGFKDEVTIVVAGIPEM